VVDDFFFFFFFFSLSLSLSLPLVLCRFPSSLTPAPGRAAISSWCGACAPLSCAASCGWRSPPPSPAVSGSLRLVPLVRPPPSSSPSPFLLQTTVLLYPQRTL